MCKLISWRLSGWPANGTTLSLISHSQGDFNHCYVKLLLGDKGTERQNLETQFMQSPKWKQEPEYPCGTSYNTELDHNFRTRAWKILILWTSVPREYFFCKLPSLQTHSLHAVLVSISLFFPATTFFEGCQLPQLAVPMGGLMEPPVDLEFMALIPVSGQIHKFITSF